MSYVPAALPHQLLQPLHPLASTRHPRTLSLVEIQTWLGADIGTRVRAKIQEHLLRCPDSIVPEFTTYNIFQAYSMRIKLTVERNGKTRRFERGGIGIRLVERYLPSTLPYNQVPLDRDLVVAMGNTSPDLHNDPGDILGSFEGLKIDVLPPYSPRVRV